MKYFHSCKYFIHFLDFFCIFYDFIVSLRIKMEKYAAH